MNRVENLKTEQTESYHLESCVDTEPLHPILPPDGRVLSQFTSNGIGASFFRFI